MGAPKKPDYSREKVIIQKWAERNKLKDMTSEELNVVLKGCSEKFKQYVYDYIRGCKRSSKARIVE